MCLGSRKGGKGRGGARRRGRGRSRCVLDRDEVGLWSEGMHGVGLGVWIAIIVVRAPVIFTRAGVRGVGPFAQT